MSRFDATQVRRYYDRNTPGFVAFGQGGSVGAIHRAVWGPGVQTRADAFHYVEDRIAELIRTRMSSVAAPHVVDLGCGVGASLCYLSERLPILGTGITLSQVQARFAMQRIEDAALSERVTCFEGDYCDLPATLPQADLAYAIESFVHAPSAARFFRECAALVRAGGLLVICDDFRRSTTGAAASRTIERFCRGWHINTLLEPDELHSRARAAGFEHQWTMGLSPFLELRRTRDRVVDAVLALLGRLPLHNSRFGHLPGGSALQTCLQRGWIAYDLVIFRRQDPAI